MTPVNNPPQAAVARARLSEQLGFDLVTFQDHPYISGFHDTWTLLSWVAAQTTTIRVAGNVLNIPLRPAPVLARAVASLDLLSDGRVTLGLGAGGQWDAIAAMSGTRRTPAESVDQLSEAIDVMHEIWQADERGRLRYDGDYYQLDGTKRGPSPAHRVPIWVGARKPRMLRLIGAKADGWLPSYSYLEPGELTRSNQIIDEAAVAAGRAPTEIRRVLNFFTRPGAKDPSRWIDELVRLVLEDGIATIILGTDDPGELERFATQVIPPVRDQVAKSRAQGPGDPGR
ncbi:LLM class flavin-dependent oxidoreductase [Actinoplanes sp. TBRC 11911]|nr:LLM class flavin-dependent oxidoreductase [Actinoplanes sp. TBRC 11911]